MSAGDLMMNLSQNVIDFAAVTRHERIIMENVAAFSTKIALLKNLWMDSDGSSASKELLYDRFDEEHVNLRAYVTENRAEIVRLLPALEGDLKEYFAPNPYKDNMDECDEHREFVYFQKTDFCDALERELNE